MVSERDYARKLTFEFNHTRPSDKKLRQKVPKQLIVTKGSFNIEAPFNCDYGDNVWVDGGTIICRGVKIGNNVTIGAGSVVTKDIPDNVVAVGNTCRVTKMI